TATKPLGWLADVKAGATTPHSAAAATTAATARTPTPRMLELAGLRDLCFWLANRHYHPVRPPDQMPMRLGAVPARNRDVELGIAPHAVLGHVQAGRLDVLLDADPTEPLHRPEAPERRAERERADGSEAESLHAELVERTGVDEPTAARRQIRGQRRDREEPRRQRS